MLTDRTNREAGVWDRLVTAYIKAPSPRQIDKLVEFLTTPYLYGEDKSTEAHHYLETRQLYEAMDMAHEDWVRYGHPAGKPFNLGWFIQKVKRLVETKFVTVLPAKWANDPEFKENLKGRKPYRQGYSFFDLRREIEKNQMVFINDEGQAIPPDFSPWLRRGSSQQN